MDTKDGQFLLSYPPALGLHSSDFTGRWTDDIDGDRQGDLTHFEMWTVAKRTRKTVFNFNTKDLETDSKRIIEIAHPMYDGRIFWGVIFWELDLVNTLE